MGTLYVIVIARLPGIYGSKPTSPTPRIRVVYIAINPRMVIYPHEPLSLPFGLL
jgi:hypothetical protein